MSMFGRQPAADLLKQRGIKRQDAAQRIGVKHSVLNNTLAGRQAPSQLVRDGLVKLLGEPIEKLFGAEPLAREQGRRYRQGAMITAGDDPTIRHLRRKSRNVETEMTEETETTVKPGGPDGDVMIEKMNGTEG